MTLQCRCGAREWFACQPGTVDETDMIVWCRKHWQWAIATKEGSMRGTRSSSGGTRTTGTTGAPSSHVVSKGKPAVEAGTNASKASAMSKAPGAFKSRPGRGNSA